MEPTLRTAILALLPTAQIEQDNEGQLVIYAGVKRNKIDTPIKTNRRKMDLARNRTIVVLDDDETWSNVAGCMAYRLTAAGAAKLGETNELSDITQGPVVDGREIYIEKKIEL